MLAWRAALRERGRRLVQCHGCFDIVHPGHVRHLRWARARGDALLVTITADRGISKGPGRPLIPHDLRAENLASLDMVDAVHIVHEPTAEGILRDVEPDVYVKGREYESNDDPRFAAERQAVQSAGGRVVFSSGDIVFSSSALIAALESGRDTGVDAQSGALAQLMHKPGLSGPDLRDTLHRTTNARVLVIGEAIEEVYRVCQAPLMGSREPVMTLRPGAQTRFDAGAAGVALQLAAMGARPTLLTCLPESQAGRDIELRLHAAGVRVEAPVRTTEPLLVEHYLSGAQKLMTIDHARPIAADAQQHGALIHAAADLAPTVDAVCVADQGLGLLSRSAARQLVEAIRPRTSLLTASAQARSASPLAIRHADLLVANEPELRRAVANPSGSLTSAAWSAMDAAQARAAIVGLGPEGLVAFGRLSEAIDAGDGWPARVHAQPVPSLAPISLDQSGADAAVLAAATLGLLGAQSSDDTSRAPVVAAMLGALAESIAVTRPGHTLASLGELIAALDRLDAAHLVYTDAGGVPSRATA